MTKQFNSIALIGRLLLSSIFIVSGIMKFLAWEQMVGYVAGHGIPYPQVALFLAAALELLAGLGILFGLGARAAAAVLFLYLIPVTLLFHPFWEVAGAERQMQIVNFLKNLTIMGGLLVLVANGPGRASFDERRFDLEEEERDRGLRAA